MDTATAKNCPECSGTWRTEDDTCAFCRVIYGERVELVAAPTTAGTGE
jgi:hypothetical protein